MDGIIVINKGKGCTSHDVVYQVKKLFGVKVGHTGTLDPNATGVLPILIGKGTELSQFLICHDKKYVATLKLGIKTDSADSEGHVIEEKEVDKEILTEENVNSIFKNMIGCILLLKLMGKGYTNMQERDKVLIFQLVKLKFMI